MFVCRGIATIAALALMLAPAGAPATASASSRDLASTHTLVTAGYALAKAGVAKIPNALAAARHVISTLGRQCPGAGEGAPQDEEAQRLGLEAAGALWSAAYGTAARQIKAFVRAVKPLRWSSARVTRTVQSFARGLGILGALPMPPLCADVAQWRASGFSKVPASTESYDRLVEQTEIHAIPESLLRPYEGSGDHALAVGIKRLEGKLERAEVGIGFEYWNTLLEKLGLPQ
jgi:hypothetical protein